MIFFFITVNLFFAYNIFKPEEFVLDTGGQICLEQEKPQIVVYATPRCPHCIWLMPKLLPLFKEYEDEAHIEVWEYDGSINFNLTEVNNSNFNMTKIFYNGKVGAWDNLLTEEIEEKIPLEKLDLFFEVNPKITTPTIVFGCRYVKIGNHYESENDIDKELELIEKYINKLL